MKANTNNHVDRAAHADFVGIFAGLGKSQLISIQGSTRSLSREVGKENELKPLDHLANSFELVAKTYFKSVQQAIQNEREKDKQINDAYYYDQALTHLMNHAQLLSEMTDPRFENLRFAPLIRKIITNISTRLNSPPLFIPIISSEFKYIHFNYLDGIGVIGVPLTIWNTPTWNLSILWHEVAGYAVATAKRYGHLEDWAIQLAKKLKDAGASVWCDYYLKSYEKSYLKKVRLSLELFPERSKVDMLYEIRQYFKYTKRRAKTPDVEHNLKWQMIWLGEFFEDLFAAQALKGTLLEILADVLRRRYKVFGFGDHKHPSPELRLQVVLQFLYLYCSDDRQQIEQSRDRVQHRYQDLKLIEPNPALRQTAEIIAKLYIENIGIFSKQEIMSPETEAVNLVRDLYNRLSTQSGGYNADELDNELTQAENSLTEAAIFVMDSQPSDYIWTSVNIDINAEEIDLDTLLKVQFIDTDKGAPNGISFPPPF
jgi:hypothetical protein